MFAMIPPLPYLVETSPALRAGLHFSAPSPVRPFCWFSDNYALVTGASYCGLGEDDESLTHTGSWEVSIDLPDVGLCNYT